MKIAYCAGSNSTLPDKPDHFGNANGLDADAITFCNRTAHAIGGSLPYAPPLKESVWLVPFGGGAKTQLCEGCGERRAWFPDGTGLLFRQLMQGESLIGRLDLSSHTSPVLRT